MNPDIIAAFNIDELRAYANGYTDATDDMTERCRRNAEAIADLERQLAEARKDADYWYRVANPVTITAGPSHAQLKQQRREQMLAQAQSSVTPWADVLTRLPADAGH